MHFMDENFWVAVSFVIFLYFAYKPVKKAILNSLDTRIKNIQETLAEAEKVKNEAESLLNEVQKEVEHFDEYKQKMLEAAALSTTRLIEKRTREMDLALSRKSDSAIMVFENEKNRISAQLRDEFTDNVLQIVRSYLEGSDNNRVSDQEIARRFISKHPGNPPKGKSPKGKKKSGL